MTSYLLHELSKQKNENGVHAKLPFMFFLQEKTSPPGGEMS